VRMCVRLLGSSERIGMTIPALTCDCEFLGLK
jgi:hypothetical protein